MSDISDLFPGERRRREELDKVAPLLGEVVMHVSTLELLLIDFWHHLRLNVPEPQRTVADRMRLGRRLATRVQGHLDARLPSELRSAIAEFCTECITVMEKRNRYVHDPWQWAIPPDREHEDTWNPTLLQMRLAFGDHPPWSEEQQPRWRTSGLLELEVFRDRVKNLRAYASSLLWDLQENMPRPE